MDNWIKKFWNRKSKQKTFSATDIIEAYETGAQHLASSFDTIDFRYRMESYLKDRFNIDLKK